MVSTTSSGGGSAPPTDQLSPADMEVLFQNPSNLTKALDAAVNAFGSMASNLATYLLGASPSDTTAFNGIVNTLLANWTGDAADEFKKKCDVAVSFGYEAAAHCYNAVQRQFPYYADMAKSGEAWRATSTPDYLGIADGSSAWLKYCQQQWQQLQNDVTNWINAVINVPWVSGQPASVPTLTGGTGTYTQTGPDNLFSQDLIVDYSDPANGDHWSGTIANGSGTTDWAKNVAAWFQGHVKNASAGVFSGAYAARLQQIADPLSQTYFEYKSQFPTKLDESTLPALGPPPKQGNGGSGPGGPGPFTPYTGTGLGAFTPTHLSGPGGGPGLTGPGKLGETGGLGGHGSGSDLPTSFTPTKPGPAPAFTSDPGPTSGPWDPSKLAGLGPGGGPGGLGPFGSGGGFGGGPGGFNPGGLGAGLPESALGGAAGLGPAEAGLAGGTAAGAAGAAGRGGIPMMPPMGGVGGAGDGRERQRTVLLNEDEDVWGAGGDDSPGVL